MRGLGNAGMTVGFCVLLLVTGWTVEAGKGMMSAGEVEESHEGKMEMLEQEVVALRQEHTEGFSLGDKNKDNKITHDEFTVVQRDFDAELSDKDIEESFADLDKDGSGAITLDEWMVPFEETVNGVSDHGAGGHGEVGHHGGVDDGHDGEQIQHFEKYDKNGDGHLDVHELDVMALHAREEGLNTAGDENLVLTGGDLLEILDLDQDGHVSLEEFMLDGASPNSV